MGDPGRLERRTARGFAAVAAALAILVAALPSPAAASFPVLPIGFDRDFLSNLSAPSLPPGGSGTLSFEVADPATFHSMSDVTLTFDVYAFNAFPGNATSSVASASPPILVTPSTSGTTANLTLAPLAPGADDVGSVGVSTAATTPPGAFAVRTALSFVANGTNYRLESRGWFSAKVWAAATELPNGSTTLNLTVLGVSGVTAETAVYVASSNWDWALALILAASLVLVGAGAYVYFRRGPKSSTGAR